MDKCTKFKIFNVALLFCVLNFFLYRFFAYPGTANATDWVRQAIEAQPALTFRPSPSGSGGGDNPVVSMTAPQTNPHPDNRSSTDAVTKGDGSGPTKRPGTLAAITGVASTNVTMALCPVVPLHLKGALTLRLPHGPLATYSQSISFEKIAAATPLLKPGGRFKPPDCVSRHRVAIIIPYRNRETHLKVLLHNLHPMLQRQQLDYGIFVIDQELPTKFNRAMLMNIGFAEAMKRYDYQCAVFHDVDLVPENDRNIYSCPQMPRHLSAAIDKFNYRLPYAGIYGGVSAMTKEHMMKVNGFSNLFFGWGGEDDDMATRIRASGLKISRYPMEVARYRMIKHTTEKGNEQNPQRHELLKYTSRRMPSDGLNSLKYTVKKEIEFPTHLQILVYINQDDYKT